MSRSEHEEQCAVSEWLDWHGILWIHVGHEGKRHPAYAKKLKDAGVKPGCPDVMIFESPPQRPERCGTAIELKRRDGVPSDLTESQRDWLNKLAENGWVTEICYGADDTIEFLEYLGYE